MQPESRKLLEDILQAGNAILEHAAELTPEEYETDVLKRSLVERQCEIIGEAMRRLERTDEEAFRSIRNGRRVIDFRNVIAHGYDVLDGVLVSQVVCEHVPVLLEDVQVVLGS